MHNKEGNTDAIYLSVILRLIELPDRIQQFAEQHVAHDLDLLLSGQLPDRFWADDPNAPVEL